jgi:4-hydroxy-3-methylbut-2-en-1-yl diphosphate reductase
LDGCNRYFCCMDKSKVIVTIDPTAGFCFGVERAVIVAEEALEHEHPVYCLGEMVHNEEELRRLQQIGLQHIDRDGFNALSRQTVLFRAHGEPPESYAHATRNNLNIIDATCPIVKKVQQRIRASYEKGEFIIIYGKPNHPEVVGLNGQTGYTALVVEHAENLDLEALPKEICLYSQTTQSMQGFHKFVEVLKRGGKIVEVNNTICRHVSNRYPQVVEFSKKADKVIFVGGRNSSNAHSLFETVKQVNPNSWFVSSIEDVDMKWFKPDDQIGVTGATSTPPWLLLKIADYISENFK